MKGKHSRNSPEHGLNGDILLSRSGVTPVNTVAFVIERLLTCFRLARPVTSTTDQLLTTSRVKRPVTFKIDRLSQIEKPCNLTTDWLLTACSLEGPAANIFQQPLCSLLYTICVSPANP